MPGTFGKIALNLGRAMRKLRHVMSTGATESKRPFSSKAYWNKRYMAGRRSGAGSYGKLAEFKAEVIGTFVRENGITSVIEYGCGDGNQLRLSNYPRYLGFDVSEKAISICKELFEHDQTKSFKILDEYQGKKADLVLSLDVIYHLIEDSVFTDHMSKLFDSATKFVIIYSSDTDDNEENRHLHVRHRKFTKWIKRNLKDWTLEKRIPNRYPHERRSDAGSFSDFYIYRRVRKHENGNARPS